ncbi:hypothetical protein pBo9 [Bovine gammaherpesvirus 4]|uniref:Uncharacterized protein ORF Bo9 n=2 Tax=Bovine herpesvirus 4 TaxID=10385 RepID=A0A858PWX7_BHV4|nr:hypothetical protein pBo9 [Bovine gammaherpesvirus 4]AAK07947.1 hypothetical protein pBo9 [Bovine gammaherpesvirus 4]AEL29772.1 hypothetical protein [Bovine gammaherpesvirus 4]AIA82773.1 hypothetical protein pBo9 [Bovine gammaherpesvirus 4]QJC19137.1 putative protein pBo9 [Bovine gammaherpesvirus 4]QJC19209.1 putative protein pBo9 [Bovine gammaherpesvirus 4]
MGFLSVLSIISSAVIGIVLSTTTSPTSKTPNGSSIGESIKSWFSSSTWIYILIIVLLILIGWVAYKIVSCFLFARLWKATAAINAARVVFDTATKKGHV